MNDQKYANINQSVITKQCALLGCILLAGFMIRFLILNKYEMLFLFSDDVNYINSAINFLRTGMVTYEINSEPTVFIMPGMPVMLGIIFSIFGHGSTGIYVLKLVYNLIGTLSILATYLIGKKLFNHTSGIVAALLIAMFPTFVFLDNLVLTETPFIFLSLFFVFFSLKYYETRNDRDYVIATLFFLVGCYFKPSIVLIAVCLLPNMILKKFTLRQIAFKSLYLAIILVLVMMPWWIRNGMVYKEFIPFTGNSADTLLLGTYQGEGYPEEPTYAEVKEELNQQDFTNRYYKFKAEKGYAEERMRQWISRDFKSFIRSYLVLKPIQFWRLTFNVSSFTGYPLLRISNGLVLRIQVVLLALSFLGVLLGLFSHNRKNYVPGIVMICTICIAVTYATAYMYVNGRYNVYVLPYVFIGTGLFTSILLMRVKMLVCSLGQKSYRHVESRDPRKDDQ